jgi:ATP-dependent DNA helicase RecG
MTQADLQAKLDELRALPGETEWVEFKHAERNFHFDDLGKYFSALSNEANLKGQPFGWLVFGVKDKTHAVVGTQFRPNRPDLDSLKQEVAAQTTNRLTFEEIYELPTPQGRVVMFQIPAALRGMPTGWKGHFYGRNGESIGGLGVHEIEQIRGQAVRQDWSAEVCAGATLDALDPAAVAFARRKYKEKHARIADEVDGWDEPTFLNKVRVAINGRLTRAAIILLGKEESVHFLSPAVARVTWILKDTQGVEKDYAHFSPPFILTVDEVYRKVRNLTLRALSGDSLFPKEITKYDDWVLREALHNCIAHQDYTQGGQINLVEEDDSLLFTNLGSFLPGTVENVIERDAPEETYRNRLLAEAMVNLNMIDTIGSGIKRMFRKQKERFLPMPDYDLSDPKRVKVRIIGKILDERFTRLLMTRTDLDLVDVIVLDKVQKRKPIAEEAFRSLKRRGLVEGRKSAPFISAAVAVVTGQEADYIHSRGSDKDHCERKVVEYLEQFGIAVRKKLEDLLFPLLSTALDEEQKRDFVKNLIQRMRREGTIEKVTGETRGAAWRLSKSSDATDPDSPG